MSASKKGGDERRTIEELQTRYLLEPRLGDIYVEGWFDVGVVSWFLGAHRRNWKVYPIDSVDVPAQQVLAGGLDDGARGRVITLGRALEPTLKDADVKPMCIADRDFDALQQPPSRQNDICLFTDFKSMELYSYDLKAIDKLLKLFLHVRDLAADEVINALTPALVDLGLLRAVLHGNGHNIALLNNVKRCCNNSGGTVRLDMRELLRRSIDEAGKRVPGRLRPNADIILAEVDALRRTMTSDIRLAIHEDDFVQLLAWYLEPHVRGSEYHRTEVVRRALMSCLESADLAQYPLFAEILKRTAA